MLAGNVLRLCNGGLSRLVQENNNRSDCAFERATTMLRLVDGAAKVREVMTTSLCPRGSGGLILSVVKRPRSEMGYEQ
jgi:hypothetical protein